MNVTCRDLEDVSSILDGNVFLVYHRARVFLVCHTTMVWDRSRRVTYGRGDAPQFRLRLEQWMKYEVVKVLPTATAAHGCNTTGDAIRTGDPDPRRPRPSRASPRGPTEVVG